MENAKEKESEVVENNMSMDIDDDDDDDDGITHNEKKDMKCFEWLSFISKHFSSLAESESLDLSSTSNSSSSDVEYLLDKIASDLFTISCNLFSSSSPSSSSSSSSSKGLIQEKKQTFQHLLNSISCISMDVAVRIVDKIITSVKNVVIIDEESTTTLLTTSAAAASILLFGNWLPQAEHLFPVALDLFDYLSERGLLTLGAALISLLNDDDDNKNNINNNEVKSMLLLDALYSLSQSYKSRGDSNILFKNMTRNSSFNNNNDNCQVLFNLSRNLLEQEQNMMNVDSSPSSSTTTTTIPSSSSILQWYVARIISDLHEYNPISSHQFYEKLGVSTSSNVNLFMVKLLSSASRTQEEETAENSKLSSLKDPPSVVQIHNMISAHTSHPSLLHLGNGITLAKWSILDHYHQNSLLSSSQQQNTQNTQTTLINTKTTTNNLSQLGLSLAFLHTPYPPPILLCGTPGSGKTSILKTLAKEMNATLLELHLDEETDSKTLLGSYTTTDTPGEFIWRPGALTESVRKGHWILLEDVDLIPMEILSALVPLLENRLLPLRESEKAHPKFRLFGTLSISHNNNNNNKANNEDDNDDEDEGMVNNITPFHSGLGGRLLLQSSKWVKVHISPLKNDEIGQISEKLYPQIPASIRESCLKVMQALDSSSSSFTASSTTSLSLYEIKQQQKILTGGRPTASIRDLRKLLHRISSLMNFETRTSSEREVDGNNNNNNNNTSSTYTTESQRLLCFAESHDVFCAACSSPNIGHEIFAQNFASSIWGITYDLAYKYLNDRKPSFEVKKGKDSNHDYLELGRGILPLYNNNNSDDDDDDEMMMNSGNTSKFTPTPFSLRLMESISVSLSLNEPVLLSGETGAGKTTLIQFLANQTGIPLLIQNLSLQTDSTDLLGGYRPIEITHLARKLYVKFVNLFCKSFSQQKNQTFLDFVEKSYEKKQWKQLSKCFVKGTVMIQKKYIRKQQQQNHQQLVVEEEWNAFQKDSQKFEKQRLANETGLAFAFTEGALVEALREGHWVLLDEINLAGSETLLRLSGLLDNKDGSVTLTERGDLGEIQRHPNFRLIACMNPATDAGKKDLPPSLRGRFTEFYVDELVNPTELRTVASRYLSGVSSPSCSTTESDHILMDIVSVYLECRKLSEDTLVDGSGQRPRYSLRTLCRALSASSSLVIHQKFSLKRALLEGFELAFEGPLDDTSKASLHKLLKEKLFSMKNKRERDQPMRCPGGSSPNNKYTLMKPFWICNGPEQCVDWAQEDEKNKKSKFVLTKTALHHLRRLSRAIVSGPYPILLEGPTSSGKTTLVEYLARKTGFKVVRINNHEHTDIQEYTGAYVASSNANSSGNGSGSLLKFQEGLLVQALRQGHWVILDELNLAPSEVLEALNRLLDDNRELYLPEINETIKAHPRFRLFATQNPSGLSYGGRKQLSKAFRNRFVELHVGDIPSDEMTIILEKRCQCPPSHAKLLVKVMEQLRLKRSKQGVFRGKDGLITPRDLLRWANRSGSSKKELGLQGFMLLAERLRGDDEKQTVRQVIEETFKVKIDEEEMYYGSNSESRQDLMTLHKKKEGEKKEIAAGLSPQSIAPTTSLLRMMCLVKYCVAQKEPVLLVGDTGCGKTTVVQLLSILLNRELQIINCHASTETSDILGSLRPLRGRELIVQEMREVYVKLVEFCCTSEEMMNSDFLQKNLKNVNVVASPEKIMSFVKNLNSFLIKKKKKSKENNKSPQPQSNISPNREAKRRKLLQHSNNNNNSTSNISADEEGFGFFSTEFLLHIESLSSKLKKLHNKHSTLFEWMNGPLVSAMEDGHLLLLDEMSLAEDAVLERLNSVLEPSRTLTLAENNSPSDNNDNAAEKQIITAHENFRIFATMNPGGDFGKRELSPALRSRFTEIWVPSVTDRESISLVLNATFFQRSNNNTNNNNNNMSTSLNIIIEKMLDYTEWFNETICKNNPQYSCGDLTLSIRDILAWAHFILGTTKDWTSYAHGAALMHLDGLGIGTSGLGETDAIHVKKMAKSFIRDQIQGSHVVGFFTEDDEETSKKATSVIFSETQFGVDPFFISKGSKPIAAEDIIQFNLEAPTTNMNLRRVLRGMQLRKPILLEGSPGVGKTSLIQALANASGHELVRINLSEQTDIADLMGSDLPSASNANTSATSEKKNETSESSSSSSPFKWCDGVFLQALKNGHWVLLDELNLASQSVLEGLNSCLDHRAEVYIPELGQTFSCPASFRIFAAQNPLGQGGGRKGLPKSFLNRFTKVYVEALEAHDLYNIVQTRFDTIEEDSIKKMVEFNSNIHKDIVEHRKYGQLGSPWEFNLRDIFRWCNLITSSHHIGGPGDAIALFVDTIYIQRLRSEHDRNMIKAQFHQTFGYEWKKQNTIFKVNETHVQIGSIFLERCTQNNYSTSSCSSSSLKEPNLLRGLLNPMEAVSYCIQQKWPCLLVGDSGSGKSTILRVLAESCNHHLEEIAMTNSSDVSELIGCFEQTDRKATEKSLWKLTQELYHIATQTLLVKNHHDALEKIVKMYQDLLQQQEEKTDESTINLSEFQSIMNVFEHTSIESQEFHTMAKDILSKARNLLTLSSYNNNNTSNNLFQWSDGILVEAMQKGYWLHLENVNYCPSSVLDRLNPLMENAGKEGLALTECGILDGDGDEEGEGDSTKMRVVYPHENFRLFLSMSPTHQGEVSRAMRNRCIEIYLMSPSSSSLDNFMQWKEIEEDKKVESVVVSSISTKAIDALDILARQGITSHKIGEFMIKLHLSEIQKLEEMTGSSSSITLRNLEECGRMVNTLQNSGWSLKEALRTSFSFWYESKNFTFSNNNRRGIELLKEGEEESIQTSSTASTVIIPQLRKGWLQNPQISHVSMRYYLAQRIALSLSSSQEKEENFTSLNHILHLLKSPMSKSNNSNNSFERYDKFCVDPTKIIEQEQLWRFVVAQFVSQCSLHDIDILVDRKGGGEEEEPSLKFLFDKIRSTMTKLDFKYNEGTAAAVGVEESLRNEPFDVRDNTPAYYYQHHKVNQEKLNVLRKTVLDRLPILLQEFQTKQKLDGWSDDRDILSKEEDELSVFDVSYLLNHGKIDRSEITCAVTPSIFPLFEQLDMLLSSSSPSEMAVKENLQKRRDNFWSFLNNLSFMSHVVGNVKFEQSEFLVHWRWLQKAIMTFLTENQENDENDDDEVEGEVPRKIKLLLNHIGQAFYMPENQVLSDHVWKKGGHPCVPNSKQSWHDIIEIEDLASSCSFLIPNNNTNNGVVNSSSTSSEEILTLSELVQQNHACLFMKENFKSDLLAALCTYYAHSTDEVMLDNDSFKKKENGNMNLTSFFISQKEQESNKFATRIKEITVDTNIKTVDNQYNVDELQRFFSSSASSGDETENDENLLQNMLRKWAKIQVSPLFEIHCLQEELAILNELSKISYEYHHNSIIQNNIHDAVSKIIPRIEKFIESVLTYTSWSISDLRPYQTLVWVIMSVGGKGNRKTNNVMDALKNLLPVMEFMSTKHCHINSFNFPEKISHVLKGPSFWKKDDDDDNDMNSKRMLISSLTTHDQLSIGTVKILQPTCNSILFRLIPVTYFVDSMRATTTACMRTTMENYNTRKMQANLLLNQISSSGGSTEESDTSRSSVFDFVKHLFISTVGSLETFFHDKDEHADMILSLSMRSEYTASSNKKKLIEFLSKCTYTPFQSMLSTIIHPLVDILFSNNNNKEEKEASKTTSSKALVYIGLLRLHLLLPSSPLDPGKKPIAKVSQYTQQLYRLGLKLATMKMETRITSDGSYPDNTYNLLGEAEFLDKKKETQSKKIVERPDQTREFSQLYKELHRFSKTVVDITQFTQFLNSIIGTENIKMIKSKEESWQSSASAFCDRLTNIYKHYEDITYPVTNSIRHIQRGLIELIYKEEMKIYDSVSLQNLTQTQQSLLQFPISIDNNNDDEREILALRPTDLESIAKTQSYLYHINNSDMKSSLSSCGLSFLFASLSREELLIRSFSPSACQSSSSSSYEKISSLLEMAVDAWSQQEQRLENEKDKDSELTEEEKFQKQFLDQFPDHAKEFREIVRKVEEHDDFFNDDENKDDEEEKSLEQNYDLSLDQISLLCSMHRQLYSFSTIKKVDDECRHRCFNLSYAACSQLMSYTSLLSMPNNNGSSESGAHYMGIASSTQISPNSGFMCDYISGSSSEHAQCVDFHRDPNPFEVMKADPILQSLLKRAGQLLSAFPGHPTLIIVGQLIETLRGYDIGMLSMGKALACLEVILRKAQDWEQHASKHVMLGDALTGVGRLVHKWRKLELESWKHLLDVRQFKQVQRARCQWPRLHKLILGEYQKILSEDTTITTLDNSMIESLLFQSPSWVWKGLTKKLKLSTASSTLIAVEKEAITKLTEFVKVLDGFLFSSSTGEYSERVSMIYSFGVELSLKKSSAFANIMSQTILSLVKQHSYFVPTIETHATKLREPIEKRLKDEVKLSRWDEQTYYSLQESSEKSHLKLMRFMKEYDEVMEWRVNQILEEDFLFGVRSSSSSETERATCVPTNTSIFPDLSDGDKEEKIDKKKKLVDLSRVEKSWIHSSSPTQHHYTGENKYLINMNKYFTKMKKILLSDKFQSTSNATIGFNETDSFTSQVFERIDFLRSNKNVTTPMKQRALVDLFKTLKSQGFSSLKWNTPNQIRNSMYLLQLPTFNNNKEKACDDEKYFYRCLLEISRLRSEISTFGSAYFSSRETSMMLALSESGLFMLCQQKCLIAGCEEMMKEIHEKVENLCETTSFNKPMQQDKELLTFVKTFESSLLSTTENLKQLILLLKTINPLYGSSDVLDMIAMIQGCVSDIEVTYSSYVLSSSSQKELQHFLVSKKRIECIEKASLLLENTLSSLRKCQHMSSSSHILSKDIFESSIQKVNLTLGQAKQCLVKCNVSNNHILPAEVEESSNNEHLVETSISNIVEKSLLAIQKLSKNMRITQVQAQEGEDHHEKKESMIEKDNEQEEISIMKTHISCLKEWNSLNISDFDKEIEEFTHHLFISSQQTQSKSDSKTRNSQLLLLAHKASLMMNVVLHSYEQRLIELKKFYRSSSKLFYVLVRIFRVLVAKGFCVPQDESEGGEGDGEGDVSGMTFEDDVEGTGMGEGEGKNDVTDQIENEEQLLGLKGDEEKDGSDKQQQEQLDEEEAEKGMEMEGDFEGDMYDMPEQSNQDENKEGDDSDEEEELDREMGDDSSPNDEVVDEKMWDDEDDDNEDGDNQGKEKEKFERDSKIEGEQESEEYRTKDDEEEQDKDKDPKGDEKEDQERARDDKQQGLDKEQDDANEEKNNTDETENNIEDQINEDLEENYEENHMGDIAKENDDESKDQDDLELDGDLDLDGGDDESGGEEGEEEAGVGENEGDDMNNKDEDEDEAMMDGVETTEKADDDEDEEQEQDEEINANANHSSGGDPEHEAPESIENENEEMDQDEPEPEPEVDLDDNSNDNKDDGEAHGVSGNGGDFANSKEEEKDEEDGMEQEENDGQGEQQEEDEDEKNVPQSTAADDGENDEEEGEWKPNNNNNEEENNGGSEQQQQQQEKKMMNQPNPFRDLGDVEKFWHSKLNMIDDDDNNADEEETTGKEESDQQQQQDENVDMNSTFQFTRDNQASTTQTLGTAMEDDVTQLEDVDKKNEQDKMDDDNDNNAKEQTQQDNDHDTQMDTAEKEEEDPVQNKKKKKEQIKKTKKESKQATDDHENDKDKDDSKEQQTDLNQVTEDEHEDENMMDADADDEERDPNVTDSDDEEEIENKIVTDLDQLHVNETTDTNTDTLIKAGEGEAETFTISSSLEELAKARTQWNEISGKTSHMSRRLCEKLRLVMEPLLATKLRGDYRTGKRINMKRVIGFIASGYRKDKIWLRRTKPSKRDYRVLVAVDDSESMKKNGTDQIALEALSVLANGMTQLEIGDFGIASFGDEMRLLHPFSSSFTNENGADICRNFKFDQTRTRITLCVESAMNALEEASSASSSSESLQLVFMISDGRIERDSRSRIRKLVREMSERNILLVMIIVEAPSEKGTRKKDSIVNMKEVSFENGKPVVKYFIQDYPFPYYMVLEDMTSLPEVLGDALKQWFEMLSQMQNGT